MKKITALLVFMFLFCISSLGFAAGKEGTWNGDWHNVLTKNNKEYVVDMNSVKFKDDGKILFLSGINDIPKNEIAFVLLVVDIPSKKYFLEEFLVADKNTLELKGNYNYTPLTPENWTYIEVDSFIREIVIYILENHLRTK